MNVPEITRGNFTKHEYIVGNSKIKFSKNNTTMVVIEGGEVQGYPPKNHIRLKPYNISSSKEENLLI